MEYFENPVLWEAHTKKKHIKLESLLHTRDKKNPEKKYRNFKFVCYYTDAKNTQINCAAFFIHYSKLRAILKHMNHLFHAPKFTQNMKWKLTAKDSNGNLRNLTIYFNKEKLAFVFNDPSIKTEKPKFSGKVNFVLGIEYKKETDKEDREFCISGEQRIEVEMFLGLVETINAWEIVHAKEIFKPIPQRD